MLLAPTIVTGKVFSNGTFWEWVRARWMQNGRGKITPQAASSLVHFGFVHIGRIELLNDSTVLIKIELAKATKWVKPIYAFVVGGEIKRVGRSRFPLDVRFSDWSRNLTNALKGLKSPISEGEARAWRECLHKHNGGEVYARLGSAGVVFTFRDEEPLFLNPIGGPFNAKSTTPWLQDRFP
jgi:hypothetical protein